MTAAGANGVWDLKAAAEGRYFQRFEIDSAATIQPGAPLTARVRSFQGSLGGRPLALARELVISRGEDSLDVEPLDVTLADARARGSWHVREGALSGALDLDRVPLDLLKLVNPTIDLRGTAVTRLALAGCSESEIATISGHSLRDVRSILDSHYLHRDPALAESAIRKLETKSRS